MLKTAILLTIVGMFLISGNFVFAQEISLATFQETAQILIDKSRSQNVTASITLQTTSTQEIKIPAELEKKIRENERITSVIFTNQEKCVLGVVDESCIMINVQRDPADKGIIAIQDSTRELADLFIDEINQAFDTKAEFHSTYLHSDDEINQTLETSGAVSGRGIVSAVYTLPMEDTQSMYEKLSGILLPKEIRDKGGFYEIAKNLSSEENSKMTFSLFPMDNNSLLQLQLSVEYPLVAENLTTVKPLEFFKIDELKRSDYFSSGFYPLNSIVQVVILSNEPIKLSNVQGKIIPTQIIDGEKIPTEITKKGWVFDPDEGEKIQGKFIFGDEDTINQNELIFSLGDESIIEEKAFDESLIILTIIIVGGIAAALFFLKGYKK